MNNQHKKFIKHAIVFIILSLGLALVIESLIDHDFEELKELNFYLPNDKPVIVYFNDSVGDYTPETDHNKRSVGELLGYYLKKPVVEINHGAYHLGVYEAFSDYIISNKYKPELVIIPINLRSLSMEWDTRPAYQFNNEIKMLKNESPILLSLSYLFKRINRLFSDDKFSMYIEYIYNKEEKWENSPVFFDNMEKGIVKDYIGSFPTNDSAKKSKYIFHYSYPLDNGHRKIANLKTIIKNYKSNNIPMFIYITPINYESGETYVGKNFTDITKKNIKIIKNAGNESGVKIHDLSYSLNQDYLAYPNEITEHLNETGRKFIAEYITREIRQNY